MHRTGPVRLVWFIPIFRQFFDVASALLRRCFELLPRFCGSRTGSSNFAGYSNLFWSLNPPCLTLKSQDISVHFQPPLPSRLIRFFIRRLSFFTGPREIRPSHTQ
jgi:hypothetical protein